MTPKRTPLYHVHKALGARMVQFAGWEMPVQYEGALKEHLAVRDRVGVFDISHMGELEITGEDALTFVQRVACNDASRLSEGQAQYSALLYPEGTFVDDIVVYRIGPQHFLFCVNAANKDKNLAWLLEQQEGRVNISDRSEDYVQLAIQGPRSEETLQELTESDLSRIPYYRFTWGRVAGKETLISRTGYTGEDGFEIYLAPEYAEGIWKRLFEAGAASGISAVGLAARNTLRLEMKYALYGNDIDDTTTPLEAGLGWVVKLEKGDFIGRAALQTQQEQGVKRKLVGFEMIERGIARDQYPVFFGDRQIGRVTSGSFAPSVQKAVGLTYLPAEQAEIGQEFRVGIRGRPVKARVTETPFYRRS